MIPERTSYDVVILGSGIGGSMLASILARRGVSVLLVEELVHPRFTIGESLIPETGVRFQLLAAKYDVPEIAWLGSFYELRDRVSSNCGTKRAFSFVYHREGEAARPAESNQLPTLTPPYGPDSHMFRQDVDAWLATVSTRYGVTLRQGLRIQDIAFEPDQVRLTAASGEQITTRFLVDGGGMRSLVASKLGLRDATPRFRTDTRTLYTHFAGLRPFDHVFTGDHGLPSPLGQGTMHNVFHGGWMWLIPFNNHRDATNPLVSVGVMLDRRRFGDPKGSPEDEFKAIIARFPTVARHFEGAVPVRPWVASGRLQYSSPTLVAHRMVQLPHAAAFVDPLYSSGLSVLTVAIDLIADALFPALAEDNFDVERFALMDKVVNEGFDHYDRIVSRSFDAFADYDLWNAWNRNWVMGNYLGTFGALSTLIRYQSTGDRALLKATTDPQNIGVLSSHLPEVRAAMDENAQAVDAVTRGELTPADAAAQIFARLGALPFLPPYMGFGRADQRVQATFTLQAGVRHVLWYRHRAPAAWAARNDLPLLTYASQVLGAAGRATSDGLRRTALVIRDVLSAGNSDADHRPPALSGVRRGLPGEQGEADDGAW
ncbi:MAG: tryptophan 7-halogenase [Deltaproteobacteria bacterium]|nr:tryptophan 7-halogenase [Deltaproteobacteria bacterium]MBK9648548.1 tryptophan 7-halogenase [Deltaproteobacteria bacterium]